MGENYNYYKILNVEPDASTAEIKKAYRKLAKDYHPDVSNDPDCVAKFRAVAEAYEILSDPDKRIIYDTDYNDWGKFTGDKNYGDPLNQLINDLINKLNDPDSSIRNHAVDALVDIGETAFEAILRATRSDDDVIRRKTCDILGRMGNPRGVMPLVRLLTDPDRYVRRRAANALILIGDKRVLPNLINSLNDPEPKVRSRVAQTLGKIGDVDAAEPLVIALRDPDEDVRRSAREALNKIGWEPGLDELAALYWIALDEWDNCLKIGMPAVNPLINELNSISSESRNAAVNTLVKMGPMIFEPVEFATKMPDEVIRRKTCDILGLLGDPRGVIPLTKLLNDRNPYVRRRAANALILVGDSKAVQALQKALHDTEKKVRSRSAEALGKIGDKNSVEHLITATHDSSSTVRLAAIIALGQIGDQRAIEPLNKALQDKNSNVRSTAAKTLNKKFNVQRQRTSGMYSKTTTHSTSETTVCPKCSSLNLAGTNFCTKCGTTLPGKAFSPHQKVRVKKVTLENLEYIEKLYELKEGGIITDEEFQIKKKSILKM